MTHDEIVSTLAVSPGFISITNRSGVMLWNNRYGYGYSPEDVIGRPSDGNIHPADRAEFAAARRRVATTGETVVGTVRLLTPESEQPVIMAFRMSGSGDRVVCWAWDVSGVRAAEPIWTPIEQRIIAAVGRDPINSRKLAVAVETKYNSRFRASLTKLVDAGALRRTSRGYCLP